MNDDRRRLDDILDAIAGAELISDRGRDAFDGDPLVVRAAKNIVTEIGEATKALGAETDECVGSGTSPRVTPVHRSNCD